ncbi:MAG: hypothetical protein AB7P04_11575 [Bacteriovoracia bacterium]
MLVWGGTRQGLVVRWIAFLFVIGYLAFFAPFAGAGPADLARLLRSSVGRFLIAETEVGSQITTRLLGRGLQAGEDAGLLLRRLELPEYQNVASRLERKLVTLQRRFLQTFPAEAEAFGAGAGAARALSAEQRALLGRLVSEELQADFLFFNSTARGTYGATRRTIERMVEAGDNTAAGAARAPMRRYPLGVDPVKQADWALRFGFESEYAVSESGKLLSVYGPAPEFGISAEQWLTVFTEEQRLNWVRENLTRLFPTTREPGKLVKLTTDAQWGFLPDQLIKDATGNLEIVLRPFNTLEDWQAAVTRINESFGAGSMQATIGCPSNAFFGRVAGQTMEAAYQENIGFFSLMNDLDSLEKLELGAERFAADASKEAARSFNHPFLGPMTRLKQEKLMRYLQENAADRMFDAGSLGHVRGNDASFKYVGGTVYRPDLDAPFQIVFEVRDAHTNMPALVDRLLRVTFYLQHGRAPFAGAAHLRAFDSIADFALFSPRVQELLRTTFPAKLQAGATYTAEETLAVEVFRNFAFPMKNWGAELEFIGAAGLREQVVAAQQAYVAKLEAVAAEVAAGTMTRAQASLKIQGSVAEFAAESGLPSAMRRWQGRNLLSDPTWRKYMNLAVQELGPLREAFPKTVWEGALETRLSRFVAKWPEHAQLVDDVRFSFQAAPGAETITSSRKVLVISTAGLTPEQAAQIGKEYAECMARGTVSFPLGEAGGHLYTRLGTNVYASYGSFTESAYAMGGRRLEAVVALNPQEEIKLRYYVENAKKNRDAVVGSTDYYGTGAAVGNVEGKLTSNRVVGQGGHNCTSWMCTAPIGQNGQKLLELAGAGIPMEVHTNPGWWSYYLTGAAKAERLPVVSFWTEQSLADAQTMVRSGQAFPNWNFGLH